MKIQRANTMSAISRTAQFMFCVLLSFAYFNPSSGLADTQTAIKDALERVFENSRFELVKAEVHECRISLRLEDKDVCSVGHNFWRFDRFVDLTLNEPDVSRAHLSETEGGQQIVLRFQPVGIWAALSGEIEKRKVELMRDARTELGAGPAAAAKASEKLLEEFSINRFRAFTIRRRCNMGNSVEQKYDRMRLNTDDPQVLLSAIEDYARACRRSAVSN